MARAGDGSKVASVAPGRGARIIRPTSMPGRLTSEAYWCRPVTNCRPSTFGSAVPATRQVDGAAVSVSSCTTATRGAPFVTDPIDTDSPPGRPSRPSVNETSPGLAFHCSAARATSSWRAADATRRSWAFMMGVVRLPRVPMSKGVRAVSPITSVTTPGPTCSSSATAWVSDVRMF